MRPISSAIRFQDMASATHAKREPILTAVPRDASSASDGRTAFQKKSYAAALSNRRSPAF